MALPSQNTKPIQLHIMHSWGGGLERWVDDYCRVDQQHMNLILKSVGVPGIPGQQIALYQSLQDRDPLKIWELTPYIYNTAIAHLGYCYILEEIIEQYQVSTILISSLIGHSLDALNTGLRTLFICHDYYPFCPALNIYFHKICTRCTVEDLKSCFQDNPYNRFLPMSAPEIWEKLREYFLKLVIYHKITFIVPSQSVKNNLKRLEPRFKLVRFFVISHGIEITRKISIASKKHHRGKLRILVLGSLSLHKGLQLLQAVAPQVSDIAEFLLLGYGEEGAQLQKVKGIRTIAKTYRRSTLPDKVEKLAPDLGLLLSVVPETFNYTLSELKVMGIPTMTTNVGSFSERTVDGVNGFLVSPEPTEIIAKIQTLHAEPDLIEKVTKIVALEPHKTVETMVQEYQHILRLDYTPKQRLAKEISLVERLSLQPQKLQFQAEELAALKKRIAAMETSKFWKLREAWFKVKRVLGLPIKE
ncbi:MAG: glycosyltransferase [Cyanobacteria bacterium]|nr:glycosyltransferase [Cyanobacteria bacterium GSL.Bin21]